MDSNENHTFTVLDTCTNGQYKDHHDIVNEAIIQESTTLITPDYLGFYNPDVLITPDSLIVSKTVDMGKYHISFYIFVQLLPYLTSVEEDEIEREKDFILANGIQHLSPIEEIPEFKPEFDTDFIPLSPEQLTSNCDTQS